MSQVISNNVEIVVLRGRTQPEAARGKAVISNGRLEDRSRGCNVLPRRFCSVVGFPGNLQSSISNLPSLRPAFSLVELVVVMGVMVLMLSLAGQVMSLTVRTSGQAIAFTETMQAVREMERTLREDLRHVRRDRSVMVIQGNPINAYWTTDGRDADDDGKPETGYPITKNPDREIRLAGEPVIPTPPRADILMFFTERKANSYITYQARDIPPTQVTSQIQQVVYGHALLGEYERGTAALQFGPDYDPQNQNPRPFPDYPKFWRVPAAQWHLARRVVHLLPVPPPPTPMIPVWADYSSERLDHPRLLQGGTDLLCLNNPFTYEAVALTPSNLGDPGGPPRYWPEIFESNTKPYARSQMDPTPPPAQVQTMGHYMMPGCASFKVEWALDSQSSFVAGKLQYENGLYWIDPGDLGIDLSSPNDDEPLDAIIKAHQALLSDPNQVTREQALMSLLETRQGKWDTSLPQGYSLQERFGGGKTADTQWRDPMDDTRPHLHVFVANRSAPALGGEPIPDDVFPKALRITVEVYDKLQRLDQPIRHVMILPVGEE